MTLTDLAKSAARTIIPYVVGLVIAVVARYGIKLDAQLTAALTVVVGSLYWAVVRLLERYVTPRFGWLLGLAQQPVYAKVTTRKDVPTPKDVGVFHVQVRADTTQFREQMAALAADVKKIKRRHRRSLDPSAIKVDVAQPTSDAAKAALAVPVTTVVLPEKQIKGKRLGRHREHDERSRAYAVTPHPQPVTVLWKRHVHPFDQGNLGSCTGNAMAGALSTAPFTHRFTESRAVKLYEAATRLDNVPGQYPPDDTGSSGLAVAKAAQQAGYITNYLHCFTVGDVISALQDGPVVAGTNWYGGMDNPDAQGFVTVSGAVRGGHEWEIVGVDLEQGFFTACNSWGTSWGDNGYFRIRLADMQRLLDEQGDVTVPRR